MPNIKVEIHKPNKNTLEKAQQKHPDTQLCNCTNKKQCSLNGKCLCYGKHKNPFTKQLHKNDTELSKKYWTVKQLLKT